jgi:DNA-directed RNA polymerase subunit RPC12/RpoP
MEKAFCIKDTHFSHNSIARYITLDRRVDYVIFLKKTDWPNRVKEEVLRCPNCKSFVLPKEKVGHKMVCKERVREIIENGNENCS